MIKRWVLVSILVVMAMLAMAMPVAAQMTPSLNIVTVYADDELVGSGVTIEAYVGAGIIPRATATTDEFSKAVLLVGVTREDLRGNATLRFTIDESAALPEVVVSLIPRLLDIHTVQKIVVWDLPYGLDEDPKSMNLWKYPDNANVVLLTSLDVPADLNVIWHYGGPTEGWTWFVAGWTESTLLSLVPGEIYTGIATTATEWLISQ